MGTAGLTIAARPVGSEPQEIGITTPSWLREAFTRVVIPDTRNTIGVMTANNDMVAVMTDWIIEHTDERGGGDGPDRIEVNTYSPVRDEYQLDAARAFHFDLDFEARFGWSR